MRTSATRKAVRRAKTRGFSIPELVSVVVIILIMAAIAIPKVATALANYRLRGTSSSFSAVVQTARWRAVQDDRFYSVRFLTQNGALEGYVDIYPQNVNGSSGNGSSGPIDPNDPQVVINAEVTPQAQGNAPNTNGLKSQLLPAGSSVVPVDGSTSPITFGPRGIPCATTTTNGTVAAGSATVCNSAGGLQAYWVFFQDSATQAWEAVTVTPAGRIQVWIYKGSWAVMQI